MHTSWCKISVTHTINNHNAYICLLYHSVKSKWIYGCYVIILSNNVSTLYVTNSLGGRYFVSVYSKLNGSILFFVWVYQRDKVCFIFHKVARVLALWETKISVVNLFLFHSKFQKVKILFLCNSIHSQCNDIVNQPLHYMLIIISHFRDYFIFCMFTTCYVTKATPIHFINGKCYIQ